MKIDLRKTATVTGTRYPPPFDTPCLDRVRQTLGDAASLTQFGVNLLRLTPGTGSSQRHWHTREDEFIYVVAGEVVLVTGTGEQILRAGDAAGFRAGADTPIRTGGGTRTRSRVSPRPGYTVR